MLVKEFFCSLIESKQIWKLLASQKRQAIQRVIKILLTRQEMWLKVKLNRWPKKQDKVNSCSQVWLQKPTHNTKPAGLLYLDQMTKISSKPQVKSMDEKWQ